MDKGYIYVRTHISYDAEGVCKLGETKITLPDRESTYITGEVRRGKFGLVLEVQINHTKFIENILKYKFRDLNIRHDGGTEFFDKKIITQIEPYLQDIGVYYRKLSEQEINNLLRRNRLLERLVLQEQLVQPDLDLLV